MDAKEKNGKCIYTVPIHFSPFLFHSISLSNVECNSSHRQLSNLITSNFFYLLLPWLKKKKKKKDIRSVNVVNLLFTFFFFNCYNYSNPIPFFSFFNQPYLSKPNNLPCILIYIPMFTFHTCCLFFF